MRCYGWYCRCLLPVLVLLLLSTVPQMAAQITAKPPNAAIVTLKKQAASGNAGAPKSLGDKYYYGQSVRQDYALAAVWYRKSAKSGNADAQYSLGELYDNGKGVPQDYSQAVLWYRKSAEQGDAYAQSELAFHYDKGQGVPQDYTQAVYWLRKAADRGYVYAQRNLGILYSSGEGVPQDKAQAAAWYRKAADQGDVEAQKSLTELEVTHPTQDRSLITSSRDIARIAFKSVVLLDMNDANGQPLSIGSGFFISGGIIATNAHVIEGASSGTAKLVGNNQKLRIMGVVALSRRTDLALLKVDSSAPSLNLGATDTSPAVGDKVYVVGNPLGLEGTFSEGIISGLRTIGADSILQMTAPISPGSSGGPVMDASGTVIGVAVATFKDGQNLNLAVPVAYLSKLLISATNPISVKPLGRLEQGDRTETSIVDGLGTRTESGVVVSNFKLVSPDNFFSGYGCEFRLSNRLPVDVRHIFLRIIYYDVSGSVMDFEDISYPYTIPAGLTKTVAPTYKSEEATRAHGYYSRYSPSGRELTSDDFRASNWNVWNVPRMEPKVEIRIISFMTEGSE